MKKLPLGIQTFEKIINNDYLYVDKTEEIYKLITSADYFFLSRPRRFGKSILISTLEEIFSGNKELFRGLYIYDRIEWKKYPVIHLDFSAMSHRSDEILRKSFCSFLDRTGEKYNISLKSEQGGDKFYELIEKMSNQLNSKVVILIDEYDKPIIDHIADIEKAKKNREVLREFYSVIKSCDRYLKFVLLTGVSKFSKVSIFSGLNNLRDITLDNNFSTILGMSEEDVKKYFSEHIKILAEKEKTSEEDLLKKIKCWYDGYSWDGVKKLYNPFSLLSLFISGSFKNYWFATGTPSFLINLIKEKGCEITEFENKEITEIIFDSYDIERINAYSLMFQTGYLTVSSVEKDGIYNLAYPNKEVRNSLNTFLLEIFTDRGAEDVEPEVRRLKKALLSDDLDGFMNIVRAIFAKIPYTLHIPAESYYHSLFYIILSLMGVNIDLEILTDKGRIDGVLDLEDKIYCIEFKYGKSGTSLESLTEEALRQIRDRKYYERFMTGGKRVILLGVGFSGREIGYRKIQL